ncbi:histidine phosphatase family protein [Rhizomonospora bruguierae]|uniref:histidine phosphatase family protein n=1 Tax=Rhizomonospora bruguierae TaxID=1581705 RepID=UPI001BCA7445|nr:histidine phosphatase family protein [Micromonospora sp. NBRC 107566]
MSDRLIIWRHGNTEWNASQRVQGHADIPLSPLGREQAAVAARKLAALRPDHILASDLRRAADTAAALSALVDVPVRADARLRERYYGEWQGLTLLQIADRYPEAYLRWRQGHPVDAHGVESTEELAKRAREALQDAAARSGTVVVTCHGGTAKQAVAELLEWPPGVARTLVGMANCHWSVLEQDDRRGGWRLVTYNAS